MSDGISIRVLALGPLQANCTIISDSKNKNAVVIDPGGDCQQISNYLNGEDVTLDAIILTHAHIDHVAGTESLLKLTSQDVPVYLHKDDVELYQNVNQQALMFGLANVNPVKQYSLVKDQQTISFKDITFQVLHTPGHSPGSISLYIPSENTAICGDVIFSGSIGRTDLWGGNFEVLMTSIKDKLFALDDTTRLITGHGPDTTIQQERKYNPFLNDLY